MTQEQSPDEGVTSQAEAGSPQQEEGLGEEEAPPKGAALVEPPGRVSRWPNRWLLLVVIASAVLIADQLTKFWAVDRLTRATRYPPATTVEEKVKVFLEKKKLERVRAEPIVIHPQHLRLRYVENPGAAWGMLGGLDDKIRIPFFYVVSLLALAFLTFLFTRLRREQRFLAVVFALILGGALGNFIDRILRGYVIDFIDVHWRHQHHFPTFNVADMAISVGLIGLFFEAIFGRRPEEETGPGASPRQARLDPVGAERGEDVAAQAGAKEGRAGDAAREDGVGDEAAELPLEDR